MTGWTLPTALGAVLAGRTVRTAPPGSAAWEARRSALRASGRDPAAGRSPRDCPVAPDLPRQAPVALAQPPPRPPAGAGWWSTPPTPSPRSGRRSSPSARRRAGPSLLSPMPPADRHRARRAAGPGVGDGPHVVGASPRQVGADVSAPVGGGAVAYAVRMLPPGAVDAARRSEENAPSGWHRVVRDLGRNIVPREAAHDRADGRRTRGHAHRPAFVPPLLLRPAPVCHTVRPVRRSPWNTRRAARSGGAGALRGPGRRGRAPRRAPVPGSTGAGA